VSMLTLDVESNFCCNVLTTTLWPCCNCVADVAALACWTQELLQIVAYRTVNAPWPNPVRFSASR